MKDNSAHPLKIGTVATATGVNVQTLRYYESLRLINVPDRTGGGFRLYAEDTIRRVRFIASAVASTRRPAPIAPVLITIKRR